MTTTALMLSGRTLRLGMTSALTRNQLIITLIPCHAPRLTLTLLALPIPPIPFLLTVTRGCHYTPSTRSQLRAYQTLWTLMKLTKGPGRQIFTPHHATRKGSNAKREARLIQVHHRRMILTMAIAHCRLRMKLMNLVSSCL